MPHYVSLMRWTSKGVAGLPAWRERVEEGERIVEERFYYDPAQRARRTALG